MDIIRTLPSHVADLIAAGEVVERPASVVKELLENSIDAGATACTVEIRNGGLTYIRVTDNGCGMEPGDAKTAFLRHATSKIRTERDLEAIGTLGFRGEALAAIAAVARIELLTCPQGADTGTALELDGGRLLDDSEAGCPPGTTIIVRNLFYNTPARLKFLKRDQYEAAAVLSAIQRIALGYPNVSIKYLRDGVEELHTPGDSSLESCVYAVLGRDVALSLLPAKFEDEYVSVTGFVSSPRAGRGNRALEFFFVNGRSIRSNALSGALEAAFDVAGVDADNDVGLVAEFLQQADFDIGVETGQDPRRMKIADEFATEFEVEAAVAVAAALDDGFFLFGEVLVVVKGGHTASSWQRIAV